MTRITISGAGGCIQNEIFLIGDALRKAGYQVQINDNWFPDEKYDDPVRIEEVRQHCISFNSGEKFKDSTIKCGPMSVSIDTHHIPWGG